MTTPAPLSSHSFLISPSSSSQRKCISTVVAPCFPFNSKPAVSVAQPLKEEDNKNCRKTYHVSLFTPSSKSDSSSSSSSAQVLYALQSSPLLPRTSLDFSGDRQGEEREIEDDFKYQQMKEEGDEGRKRCNSVNGGNSRRYLRCMQSCLYQSASFASSSFSEGFEYPVSFHPSDSAVSSSSASSSCCYISSSAASSLGDGTSRVQPSPIVRRSVEGRKGHVGLRRQPAISEEIFVPENQEEEKDEEEGEERRRMIAMMAIVGETEALEGGKELEEINCKKVAWRVVGKKDNYMTNCGRISKCNMNEESGLQWRRQVDGYAYDVIGNNEQPESGKDKLESRRIHDVLEENRRTNSDVLHFSGPHFQRSISFDQDSGKGKMHPLPLEYKKSISPIRRRAENENETRESKTGEEPPSSGCTHPRPHPIHRSSTESLIDASSYETPGVHLSDCPLDSISSTPHPSPFTSSASVAIPSASGTAGCIVASGSLAASFVPVGNCLTTPAVFSSITPPSPNVKRTDNDLDVVPLSSCLRPPPAEQKRDCTYTSENNLQQWHSAKQSRSRVAGKNAEDFCSNTEGRSDDSRLHDHHDHHPSQHNPYSSVPSCSHSLSCLSNSCEAGPPSSLAVLLCQIVVTRDELLHLLRHVPVEVLMADSEEAQSLFVLDPYSSSAAFDMTSAEEAVAVLPLPKLEFIMKSMLIYLCRDYLILLSNTIAIRVVVSRSVISSLSTEDAKDKNSGNANSSLPSISSSSCGGSDSNSRVKDSSNSQRIEEDEDRNASLSASPSSTSTGTPHSSTIFSSSTSSSNLVSSSTSPFPTATANYVVGTLAHEDEDKLYTVALCEGLVSGTPYQLDASWRDHIRSEGLVERHVQLGLTMRLFAVTPGNVAVKVPFNGVSNRRLGWEELQTICSPRSSVESRCCDSGDESSSTRYMHMKEKEEGPEDEYRIKVFETLGSDREKEEERQQEEKKYMSSIVVTPAACSSTKACLSSSLTTTISRKEKISLPNAVEAVDNSRIEERIMEALVMHAYEEADESTHRRREPEETTTKREARKAINEGKEKRREEEEWVNSSKQKERRDYIFFPFEFTLFETDEKEDEQQEATPQGGEAKSVENVEEVSNKSESIVEPHRFQEDQLFVHPPLPPVMAAAASAETASASGCRQLASYDAALMEQLLSSSSMIAHPYLPLRTINSDLFSSFIFPPSSDQCHHISVSPKELHCLYQRRLSSPSIVSQKPLNCLSLEDQCISAASSSSVSHTSLTSPVVRDSCSSSSSLSHISSSRVNARNTPLTGNTHELSYQGSVQDATVSSSTYSLPFSVKDLEKRAASLFCLRHFADNLCSLQRILPSLREADEENEIPFGGPGLRIRDFIRESLRSLQAALFEVVFIYKRDDLQDLVEELKEMMEKTP